jgi:multicomponent K+:H+ antiporter subunit F
MLAIVIPVSFALLGLAFLLTVVRLVRGPSLPDRILALDTLNVNAIALIVMGFIGTVALTKYLQRGDIIELN